MKIKNIKPQKLKGYVFSKLSVIWRSLSKIIPFDVVYLHGYYFLLMEKKLNLKNPRTFQEKLQWLKLNDRNPKYISLVDKYEVRTIISKKIGEKYLIPFYGVWDSFDDIDFNILPDQFVLKATHDSGSVIIVKNKSEFLNSTDFAKAKKKITKKLNYNYFYAGREWASKHVKPRIIAEKYLFNKKNNDLSDYKFFCFSGIPKLLFIASDRFKGGKTKFDFFDLNFTRLPFSAHGHPHNDKLGKPKNLDKMIDIATKLSEGIPHVRIDLYNLNGDIYFGEYTFYHDGGFVPFIPDEWNKTIGDFIELPK